MNLGMIGTVEEVRPLVQRGIELETAEARLAQVRIVLVEPAGALNVGAIALPWVTLVN